MVSQARKALLQLSCCLAVCSPSLVPLTLTISMQLYLAMASATEQRQFADQLAAGSRLVCGPLFPSAESCGPSGTCLSCGQNLPWIVTDVKGMATSTHGRGSSTPTEVITFYFVNIFWPYLFPMFFKLTSQGFQNVCSASCKASQLERIAVGLRFLKVQTLLLHSSWVIFTKSSSSSGSFPDNNGQVLKGPIS